jgi:hypothetical protein
LTPAKIDRVIPWIQEITYFLAVASSSAIVELATAIIPSNFTRFQPFDEMVVGSYLFQLLASIGLEFPFVKE